MAKEDISAPPRCRADVERGAYNLFVPSATSLSRRISVHVECRYVCIPRLCAIMKDFAPRLRFTACHCPCSNITQRSDLHQDLNPSKKLHPSAKRPFLP